MTPVQLAFDVLKVATPMPQSQRESLMGNAEEWWRTLGMTKPDGSEPSKLEATASKFLKTWWFMTLLALVSIPLKRYVLDYMNGNLAEEDDEDYEDDEDDEDDDQPRRRAARR